ncbi:MULTISPECIES: Na+/H+ antiporter subunit E [Alphaproteobacteria]|uniref:Sodium:proton antiporter n=2 Tax=Rhizobium/Agrobacterium group TaxID=227290 RepID=A0ABX7ES10_9HYPH|nr:MULTISPECIES: Na+/H+ antiporter subunit E [Alphaproteobacteria]ODT15093.1 MAG: hypothetical protein ABS35_32635 [Kaistia sp. SCN 65-12]QRF51119.1 sodium:proton antiporter [Rhizobium rosettiformans]
MQLVSVLNRLAIFGALWVVLTGGGVDSLAYGAAAVAVATVLSLLIYPVDRPGVVVWRAAAILPRFLVHSGLGGLDVARRAFDPRLPISPGWVDIPLSSRHDAANVLLGGLISILPGTLSAGPGDGEMDIHVLYLPNFTPGEVQADETRIHGLFDSRITEYGATHG